MSDRVAGARAPVRTGRPSLVLLVVLAVALATGAAASLLLGAATAPGAPAQPASELVVPATWIADALLGLFALVAVVLVYRRLTEGAATLSSRAVITFLVVILLGIAFVAAAQFFHPGGCPWCGGGTPGSAPPPSGNNSTATGSNNTTFGGGGLVLLSWHVPAWLEFVALAAATLLVAAVVMPFLGQWATARRLRAAGPQRPGSGPTAAEVRGAFARASRDLDRGLDPREVIERLYADLLERLGRYVVQIDPSTPEEIRVQHLVRLGIRPEVATELTRLFEEARYSTHPLGPESADRAAEAMRRATADLERAPEVA